MSDFNRKHELLAVRQRGEIFTPEHIVDEIGKFAPKNFFTSADIPITDSSCGNGNFLIKILEWRMKNGIKHADALRTIYGIELDPKNAAECRQRLQLGSRSMEVADILTHNIICADSLDPLHEGWDSVGYMWDAKDLEGRTEARNYKKEKEKRKAEKNLKKEKRKTATSKEAFDLFSVK